MGLPNGKQQTFCPTNSPHTRTQDSSKKASKCRLTIQCCINMPFSTASLICRPTETLYPLNDAHGRPEPPIAVAEFVRHVVLTFNPGAARGLEVESLLCKWP